MLSDTSKLCERQIEFCLKFINEILRLVLLGSISPNIGIGALPVLVSYGSKRLKCFKCVKKSFVLIFANVQCFEYLSVLHVFYMFQIFWTFKHQDVSGFQQPTKATLTLGWVTRPVKENQSANYSFVKPPTKQSKAPVMYNF